MSVKIAQISDIHAKPGGRSLVALARAIDWLDVARPDALIVSGDIGNPPWSESYPLVGEALKRVACPVLMVPGNKDDRQAMRAHFPDGGWSADGPLNAARTVESLKIIGLDVTIPGEKHGDGAPVVGWLREQLKSGEPALLFMHQHPFHTGFARVDSAMCRGEDILADAILEADTRVLLLVAGHGHRTVFTQFASVPAMMCPSLSKPNLLEFGDRAAPLVEPPGLALHVIESGRAMSHVIPLGAEREP